MIEQDITLIEFIEKRDAELRREINRLQQERRQLRAARAAALAEAQDIVGDEKKSPTHYGTEEPTIKMQAMAVLHEASTPLDAITILDAINTIWNKNYTRESLSPQLSRLKNEGLLSLRDKKWGLTHRANYRIQSNSLEIAKLKQSPAEAGLTKTSEVLSPEHWHRAFGTPIPVSEEGPKPSEEFADENPFAEGRVRDH